MTSKTTIELRPGDLLLIDGRHVRAVERVEANGYENARRETLYNVMYIEGACDGWSAGNSGAPLSPWTLAEQCSANVGGDPVSGCDSFTVPGTDYCPAHALVASVA
jgi:hypothetical protein